MKVSFGEQLRMGRTKNLVSSLQCYKCLFRHPGPALPALRSAAEDEDRDLSVYNSFLSVMKGPLWAHSGSVWFSYASSGLRRHGLCDKKKDLSP